MSEAYRLSLPGDFGIKIGCALYWESKHPGEAWDDEKILRMGEEEANKHFAMVYESFAQEPQEKQDYWIGCAGGLIEVILGAATVERVPVREMPVG